MSHELTMLVIETRHFTFEAVGTNMDEAWEVLLEGWQKHRTQCGPNAAHMPVASKEALEDAFSIKERTIKKGVFYRDSEVILTK